MTKLKLERYGVQELSSEKLKNVEGGCFLVRWYHAVVDFIDAVKLYKAAISNYPGGAGDGIIF